MADMDDRLAALEAEIASLREQLASQGQPHNHRGAAVSSTVTTVEEINRRSLLRKTGMAIAGAAAGAATLVAVDANPAAAASGDNLVIGVGNDSGANPTSLTSTNVPIYGPFGPSGGYTLGLANSSTAGGVVRPPLRLNVNEVVDGSGNPVGGTRPAATSGLTGGLMATFTTPRSGFGGTDGYADLFFCHRGIDKDAAITRVWGKVHTSGNANYTQFLATPARLVNTRTGTKPADNSTTEFTLAGAPADAVGFIGTITVTDTTSNGSYVSVYNGDLATIASPQFSHVNAGLGDTLATGLTVGLGASKKVKVYVFKSCHILIDVAAWVVTGA